MDKVDGGYSHCGDVREYFVEEIYAQKNAIAYYQQKISELNVEQEKWKKRENDCFQRLTVLGSW